MTLHCSGQCQEMLIPSKQTGRQMQKNLHCLFEDNCVACFCFCICFCFCPLQRFQFAIIAVAASLVSAYCLRPYLDRKVVVPSMILRFVPCDQRVCQIGFGRRMAMVLKVLHCWFLLRSTMKRDGIGGDPEEIHFLQPNQICDRAISIGSVKINTSLQMMRELPVSVSSPFCQYNSCTIFNLNVENIRRPTLVLLALNLVLVGTLEWCFEWNVSSCSLALSSARANYPSWYQKFFRCNALCETICCDYGNGRRTDLVRDDAGVSISAICPDCSLYDDAQPPQGALCNRQSSPQGYLSLYQPRAIARRTRRNIAQRQNWLKSYLWISKVLFSAAYKSYCVYCYS